MASIATWLPKGLPLQCILDIRGTIKLRALLPARDETLAPEVVRLLAPFDPVVHDRTRFELFWGWVYRFEAYTPSSKRKLGYYALPLLWGDRVIGWGNLAVKNGSLTYDLGFITGRPPRDRAFERELAAELERMRVFLDVGGCGPVIG